MPKISVIIPAYNAKAHIDKCLTSIMEQTFNDFEVIIVNDGSTDNTLELINKYTNKDGRFICYTQENNGQAAARNFAIEKAVGEYITFIDADDYVENTMLEKLYLKMIEKGADACACNIKTFGQKEITIKKMENKASNDKKNMMISDPGPTGCLIKRSIIIDNELYFLEKHIYEDLAVVPLWWIYINKISCVDEELYYYLIHTGSIMKQEQYDVKLEDIFDSINHLYKEFKKRDKENLYKEEVEYIYIKHFLHAASLRFFRFSDKEYLIIKIADIMKELFPNWKKNKYYKTEKFKYKVVCNLIYMKKLKLLKQVLKKDEK